MIYGRSIARLASRALLSAGIFVAGSVGDLAPVSAAQPLVSISQLQGSWAMTLTGNGGCGITTSYVTFTLNASGSGTATQHEHTSGCGDGVNHAPFVITSLSANGSGTANLSCGQDCGFAFRIQVSRDLNEFSVIDVTNTNNYLEGIAIHQ